MREPQHLHRVFVAKLEAILELRGIFAQRFNGIRHAIADPMSFKGYAAQESKPRPDPHGLRRVQDQTLGGRAWEEYRVGRRLVDIHTSVNLDAFSVGQGQIKITYSLVAEPLSRLPHRFRHPESEQVPPGIRWV